MLFADSMSLLWFSYYGLSLLVLLAVYFGLAFLPRLPRLVEEGEFYSGWAPSAMVAAVGVFENSASALRNGLLWLVLGIVLGAGIGVALWWWRRPAPVEDTPARRQVEDPQPTRRREPVIR